jgi:hypothetical protein
VLAVIVAPRALAAPLRDDINLRDIHPQALPITLLVVAALAFDAGRYAWCAVALASTLACREDAALVLAFDLKYLMPLFRGEPYPHLHRYAYRGSSHAARDRIPRDRPRQRLDPSSAR